MNFGLSEHQLELKRSARDFLSKECPTTVARAAMAAEAGLVPELDGRIAAMGWNGILAPESAGGSALGMLDMAVVLEECGYAALPGPFLFSAAIVVAALAACSRGSEVAAQWLKKLAAGSAVGVTAIGEEEESWSADGLRTQAMPRGDGYTLSGVKMAVPYAHAADVILVAARDPQNEADFFLIERGAPGLGCRILRGIDQTRRLCRLTLQDVPVAKANRLNGGAPLIAKAANVGAVALAADSLGGIERALEMAVEYSKVREQFGKPIGSFQALKHTAAEIVAEMEPARALLWYAAYAQDHAPDDAARAASMAKARLSDIFSRGSDRAVLMHGGIGFTWEHDIHLWFKRARLNETLFGSPAFHRERMAQLSGY